MKRIIWVICAFGALAELSAQSGFNQIYQYGNHTSHFRRLIVAKDTVVAYGMELFDTLPYQALFIARYDSSGTFIDSASIKDPSGARLTMDVNWSDLKPTSDGGYTITAGSFNGIDGVFVKLNRDLSIEVFREFEDSISLVEFYYDVIELTDGYLIGGSNWRPNSRPDGFLRKIDKQGNDVWFEYLGEYNVYDLFIGFYLLSDGTIAATGGYIYNISLEKTRPWMMRLDTNGNILSEWKPQTDVGIAAVHYLHPLNDSTWLIAGRKDIAPINQNSISQSFIATMNSNYEISDLECIGVPGPYISTEWAYLPAADGTYIGAGEIPLPKPGGGYQEYGRLVRFTADLDTLWSRAILAPVPGGGAE